MGCHSPQKMTHMSILSFGATTSRKTSFDSDFKNSYKHQNDSCDLHSAVVRVWCRHKNFQGEIFCIFCVLFLCCQKSIKKKKKRIEATLSYWMVFLFHISQRSAVVCVESAPHTPADTNSLKSTMCVLIRGWR